MATVTVGSGSTSTVIFGNGTVLAGNGNDTIITQLAGYIKAGNGNDSIITYGNGTVTAGNGNDTVYVHGPQSSVHLGNGNDSINVDNGNMTVGSGSDTISLYGNGTIYQSGTAGHDTITLGYGNNTVHEAGHATVTGPFGSAVIDGGAVSFVNSGYATHTEAALSGNVTLIGGQWTSEFIGGNGKEVMQGLSGNETFVGGSGFDTMIGGTGPNTYEFLAADKGGQHLVSNFVSGKDQLYLEGHTLSYLEAHNDVSTSGGNTYISLDGGKTSIELKGITSLSSSDVTTHKPS